MSNFFLMGEPHRDQEKRHEHPEHLAAWDLHFQFNDMRRRPGSSPVSNLFEGTIFRNTVHTDKVHAEALQRNMFRGACKHKGNQLHRNMLKSRSMWPPGGWQFREPSTGWKLPEGLGFQQAVRKIIEHRKQNSQYALPTHEGVVANQLDAYTCARLRNHANWCIEDGPPSFTAPPLVYRELPEESESAAGESRFLANVTVGIRVWRDMFGDGKPVATAIAEKRAVTCVACTKNDKKGGVLEWFTSTCAKGVLSIFAALHDMNLHTRLDKELYICSACDCPMKAKVWAPLDIIKKHMPEENFNKLDSSCWIRHENSDRPVDANRTP